MLTIEFIPSHGLYLVIPVDISRRRECPQTEFMFSSAEEVREFSALWYLNPFASVAAYNIREATRI